MLFLLHLHRPQLLIQRIEELALASLPVCTLRGINKLGVRHLHKVHENALQLRLIHILQVVSVVHNVVAAIALLVRHRRQSLTQLVKVGWLLLMVVVVLVVRVVAAATLLVLVFSTAAAAPLVPGLPAAPILIILVLATAVILPTLV